MPTAINVKEEKKAKTNIVRFETSLHLIGKI